VENNARKQIPIFRTIVFFLGWPLFLDEVFDFPNFISFYEIVKEIEGEFFIDFMRIYLMRSQTSYLQNHVVSAGGRRKRVNWTGKKTLKHHQPRPPSDIYILTRVYKKNVGEDGVIIMEMIWVLYGDGDEMVKEIEVEFFIDFMRIYLRRSQTSYLQNHVE